MSNSIDYELGRIANAMAHLDSDRDATVKLYMSFDYSTDPASGRREFQTISIDMTPHIKQGVIRYLLKYRRVLLSRKLDKLQTEVDRLTRELNQENDDGTEETKDTDDTIQG